MASTNKNATKKKSKEFETKQYIGISRDHSGSMWTLTRPATKDYNDNIAAIQEAAEANKIDTIVSVVKCGVGSRGAVEREVVNSNIARLKPLTTYTADGSSTPLFDSVGELIDLLSAVPDVGEDNVSFLIMAITDGEENSSKHWDGMTLGTKIRKLQATDRWTFVFRVPRGYTNKLASLGIPAGNILEWEQTEHGMREATAVTRSAFTNYYQSRSSGVRSSSTFYTDLKNVKGSTIRNEMTNITDQITFWAVPKEEAIRDFVERKLGQTMVLGSAFYQLTKPEKEVQDYKLICIRNKKSGAVYGGPEARQLLGLPTVGSIKLAPGDHGEFDIYIQSTSNNRKLLTGTQVLYWPQKFASRPTWTI